MGAALILPLVVIVMLAAVWFALSAKRTRDQSKAEQTLPDEPYARRQEEIGRLRQGHADSDPALTEHPARRP